MQMECSRCVMRFSDDPDLDVRDGICRHCRRYDDLAQIRTRSGVAGRQELEAIARKVQGEGKGKRHDCVVGLSGGTDSSYVALLARRLGLRPLGVHVDNGWDADFAVRNIELIGEKLGIEVLHIQPDDAQFRDLQRSFLFASTPDVEIPSDHAIQASLWLAAQKHGIRYILSGMNFRTESISVPSWSYGHSDWKYIKGVHKLYGSVELTDYPHYSLVDLARFNLIDRIRILSPLNYADYDKSAAQEELRAEIGWERYSVKHGESVYTRFVQNYLLPVKFRIDKRRGHYSDLINSGALNREDAIELLKTDVADPHANQEDRELVLAGLGFDEKQWDGIMNAPARSFREFPNSYSEVQFMRRSVDRLRRSGLYPR